MASSGSIKGQNTIKYLGLMSEFYFSTKQRRKNLILGKDLYGQIASEQMTYIA